MSTASHLRLDPPPQPNSHNTHILTLNSSAPRQDLQAPLESEPLRGMESGHPTPLSIPGCPALDHPTRPGRLHAR